MKSVAVTIIGVGLCIWHPAIFIPLFIVGAILARLIEHKKEMEWFMNLNEHIYVVMQDPDNGTGYTVLSADHLIFHASEKKMAETCRHLSDKLKRSGNQYVNDPNLKAEQRIRVIPVFMRSGEHINETPDEFQERLKAFIHKSRADWHQTLAGSNYAYYVRYHHGNGTTEFETNLEVK